MKAAMYARVSTERQKDEQTIETQLDEVKNAVEKDGNTLSDEDIYTDDGWSGAYLPRPSLDKLRQDAKNHKFDILYTYDKGRISRMYIHQEIVINELKDINIEFKSLHDINGKTPEEQVMGGVMGIFHEYERVKTSERFRIAKLNKVKNGKLLGYNPPYGYDYIPVSGNGMSKRNGKFVINNIEAENVKKIFNWVGIEEISLREVIRRLYEEGIPPKKGKRNSWTKGPVIRLLKNETYIGEHYYNKSESCIPTKPRKDRKHFKHTNKTSRRTRDRSEWLSVKVIPIIEKDLFDKVQLKLRENLKYAKRNTKHEYLFGGLTYCTCGCKRSCDGARGNYYYRCTERLQRFPEPSLCTERGINVSAMDDAAWNKIVTLLTEPSLVEQQLERYIKARKEAKYTEDDTSSISKELANLSAEENRYVGAFGRGSITDEMFDSQMANLNNRKLDLKNKLNKIKNKKSQNNFDIDTSSVQEQFKYLLDDLNFEDKLFTVRKIVDRIVATKEEITICGNIPINQTLTPEKAGLHAKYRHRRPTKRRQINIIQRTN
ncbi:hypothetical protein CVV43_02605 [Candidatus Saccharibacteria bacterium HGW-Saccharibacteria-1]|jgi:site-specific DNA recombinase|nr:MAG: hypothetical protein CVV43_02605 [Candidatus Saccharibacteria bacterium HGW-Saccharibacteria-1]